MPLPSGLPAWLRQTEEKPKESEITKKPYSKFKTMPHALPVICNNLCRIERERAPQFRPRRVLSHERSSPRLLKFKLFFLFFLHAFFIIQCLLFLSRPIIRMVGYIFLSANILAASSIHVTDCHLPPSALCCRVFEICRNRQRAARSLNVY